MELLEQKALEDSLTTIFEEQKVNIERAVRGLKVLAHPARLKIVCALRDGEFSVQKLEKFVGVAQATLSQHLSLLKDRGIVVSRRDGNFSMYSLADPVYGRLFDLVQEIYCS